MKMSSIGFMAIGVVAATVVSFAGMSVMAANPAKETGNNQNARYNLTASTTDSATADTNTNKPQKMGKNRIKLNLTDAQKAELSALKTQMDAVRTETQPAMKAAMDAMKTALATYDKATIIAKYDQLKVVQASCNEKMSVLRDKAQAIMQKAMQDAGITSDKLPAKDMDQKFKNNPLDKFIVTLKTTTDTTKIKNMCDKVLNILDRPMGKGGEFGKGDKWQKGARGFKNGKCPKCGYQANADTETSNTDNLPTV